MSSEQRSVNAVLERALDGFARIANLLGGAFLVAAAAALVSALIVLPLWLAATLAPRVYSAVLAGLVLLLLLTILVRKIRAGGTSAILPRLANTLKWVAWLAAAYVSAVAVVNGLPAIGIPLLALVIAAAGYFGGRPRASSLKGR